MSGPAENCGDSANLLGGLAHWVGAHAALVVFNAGLHDVRHAGGGGHHQVEIPEYEANLTRIVRELRAQGAAPVFATTTPVDDARHAATQKPTRLDADVRRYNEAARWVMETLEVPVVDLYPVVGPELIGADGVHLTAEGSTALASACADAIADLL